MSLLCYTQLHRFHTTRHCHLHKKPQREVSAVLNTQQELELELSCLHVCSRVAYCENALRVFNLYNLPAIANVTWKTP